MYSKNTGMRDTLEEQPGHNEPGEIQGDTHMKLARCFTLLWVVLLATLTWSLTLPGCGDDDQASVIPDGVAMVVDGSTYLFTAGSTDEFEGADGKPAGLWVVGMSSYVAAAKTATDWNTISSTTNVGSVIITWPTNGMTQPQSAEITFVLNGVRWAADADNGGSVTVKVLSYGAVGEKISGTFSGTAVRDDSTAPTAPQFVYIPSSSSASSTSSLFGSASSVNSTASTSSVSSVVATSSVTSPFGSSASAVTSQAGSLSSAAVQVQMSFSGTFSVKRYADVMPK